MVNIVRKSLLNANGVHVELIDKSESSSAGYETFDQGIPETKCFRTDKQKPNQWLSRVNQLVPIVSVSSQDRYYDITTTAHLFHGSCLNNKYNQPVTPVQFRKENPDLEFWLHMPELQNMFASIPVLGLHVGLENIEQTLVTAMQKFKHSAQAWNSQGKLFTLVNEHYHGYCVLCDLHLQQGRHAILITVLLEELQLAWNSVVDSIVQQITVDIADSYVNRNRLMASVINQWLAVSSYKRIVQRKAPEHADFICSTLSMKMFDALSLELNTAILETIKNAK